MAVLSNLKEPKIPMRSVVLNFVAWLLMKLRPYETGIGYGPKFYALPSQIMKLQVYLSQHTKDIIISFPSTNWGRQAVIVTKAGVSHRSTTHTSRKEK